MFRVVACACMLVATTSRLHAQQPATGDSLAPGTRLRVTLVAARPALGRYVAATPTELTIVGYPVARRTLLRADIKAIERSTAVNRTRGMLRGARNGAIVFGIIGALGNWAFGPYMEPPINLITTGAAVAGAVGAGVGGLMGAAIGSRVWEPIAYPAPPPMP